MIGRKVRFLNSYQKVSETNRYSIGLILDKYSSTLNVEGDMVQEDVYIVDVGDTYLQHIPCYTVKEVVAITTPLTMYEDI